MSNEAVQLQVLEDGIVAIKMQDTESRNGFSDALKNGLLKAFAEIEQNKDYRVAILTGYDSYFCSGGTKKELIDFSNGVGDFMDIDLQSLALKCPIPVISAMQGHGIGGGFVMGLFADFIILSRESIYAANFMKYGFTPGMGATLILPHRFGEQLGTEMMFSARNYRGGELEQRGIGIPVVPREQVQARALELARSLAQKPRVSLITLKEHTTSYLRSNLGQYTDKELEMHKKTFHLPETKQRINALFGN
ncbi:enoyl-CoA hydratase [Pseudoalteromonas luteoviolacea]|uniref:Enoyl-CoA hydratase n=1 Tax=Pseudoalteromonas luteoviolacea TaxID=43657 RepID=A0A1C0TK51_9GAMM|nr:polyketide synthase [Pseudoalteromonas luteoviolacea]MBQ4813836.1 enoyl-CoA hydratase/isomerase family protein [Pseudoalteromonas luteoviolacea]OCQ18827.1 enoyl-CoA hydratase [Pseudoalteromonas luteoviolacea]